MLPNPKWSNGVISSVELSSKLPPTPHPTKHSVPQNNGHPNRYALASRFRVWLVGYLEWPALRRACKMDGLRQVQNGLPQSGLAQGEMTQSEPA